MKKVMLAALAVGLCMTANVMAQVPSYVPTNGLVGWWPFNGNANDESGNGNNGTVYGATLTTDRNGVANKAYSFDGVSNFIEVPDNSSLDINGPVTIACWIYKPQFNNKYEALIIKEGAYNGNQCNYKLQIAEQDNNLSFYTDPRGWCGCLNQNSCLQQLTTSNWHFLVGVSRTDSLFFYLDGIKYSSIPANNNQLLVTNNLPLIFGKLPFIEPNIPANPYFYFNGILDDIGIWNRALTQQEITNLYNSCQGTSITSQPTNSNVTVGSSAQFSANAPAGSTFQWQSNPLNLGWQNVANNATYSGATTNTLTISNTSVSNHNQPFRAIVNAGGCIDTSDVANIIIGDTCLITVTDTLIINTTLSLPAPNNENTILIYPNPASDHITIDNGNFAAMAGYSIKITNNAGQQVFQSPINQAQFYVDLSTWTGNGLYFVHLIDPQNNTVTVRKIVLQ